MSDPPAGGGVPGEPLRVHNRPVEGVDGVVAVEVA